MAEAGWAVVGLEETAMAEAGLAVVGWEEKVRAAAGWEEEGWEQQRPDVETKDQEELGWEALG